MKVLLINGSPREKGCTYTALREVESRLNAAGIDTELLHIGKGPVQGCTACHYCYDHDGCAFDDLVNTTNESMKACDGLVVGSPVYYAATNGSLSAFLNRMFYSGDCFELKPGAAVVSARRAGTTAALDELNKYFLLSNMPLVPSQYWNMVHGNTPDEVRRDEEGMQTMRALGDNMAWLLRSIEAGKASGLKPPVREKRLRTNFIR